jgi:glycosyltransferase involved in cell wall biosynthesis
MDTLGKVAAYRAGFVHEVHAAMAGLDVLWHPSSAEGLGTVVIDAMALRVPPVVFAVGGLPELVIDGATGFLVTPNDVGAFARAAEALLLDGALRARVAANGPARAAEFGVERMVGGTLRVYDAVLAR